MALREWWEDDFYEYSTPKQDTCEENKRRYKEEYEYYKSWYDELNDKEKMRLTTHHTPFCDADCMDVAMSVDHMLDSVDVQHFHSPAAKRRVRNNVTTEEEMAKSKSTIDSTLRELQLADDEAAEKMATELEKRAEEARKAIEANRKTGSEIAVMPDKVVSPFRNYQRPVASPKMEVATPYETDTGVVMPPLPEHVCEFPEVIETVEDKWADAFDNAKTDKVLLPNNSVFSCICGKNWWVSVRQVPFHAAKYEGQHVYAWHEIRWFNFARKADLRRRKEQ